MAGTKPGHHGPDSGEDVVYRAAAFCFCDTWMMRLVLLWWISRLPSRVPRPCRHMPAKIFPDGIAQLWNVSVLGSKRTSGSGRTPDSLYQTMPFITTMA